MSKKNLDCLLAHQVQQAQRNRRIRQLADGIMFALGINPWAQDLVIWLSSKPVRTNREAIVEWIGNSLTTVDELDPLKLQRNLVARLHDAQEACA